MDANLGSLDRVYEPWPPPGGGRGYGTKRRRWCGGTGVPGGHDTHRPFTNRKAAPGEGTVIRARVGRPIPFRARSAQGPVHFPPAWRVMMRRCHPGQPGQGRGARAEGGMGAKREGANGVECTDGGWRRRRGGKGGGRREGGSRHGRAVGGSVGRGGGRGGEVENGGGDAATFMPPRGRPTLVVLSPCRFFLCRVALLCLVLRRRRRLPIPCSLGFFRLSAQLRPPRGIFWPLEFIELRLKTRGWHRRVASEGQPGLAFRVVQRCKVQEAEQRAARSSATPNKEETRDTIEGRNSCETESHAGQEVKCQRGHHREQLLSPHSNAPPRSV